MGFSAEDELSLTFSIRYNRNVPTAIGFNFDFITARESTSHHSQPMRHETLDEHTGENQGKRRGDSFSEGNERFVPEKR
jgi:hypothetical protein